MGADEISIQRRHNNYAVYRVNERSAAKYDHLLNHANSPARHR